MGAFFDSGARPTDLGYKPIYKKFSWAPPHPVTTQAISDPRAKFIPGMVPSKTLSYRMYFKSLTPTLATESPLVNQINNPLGGGFVSSFATFSVLPDIAPGTVSLRSAITFFEGTDIIDLPTDDLEFDNGILTLPSNPFRLLYAGDTTMVPENDTKGTSYWATLAYSGKLEGNKIVGSVMSDDAPYDVKRTLNTGPSFVDTSSNKVTINGSKPKFISYISIDKPIFRDVICVRAGVQAEGLNNALLGFLVTKTEFASPPITHVYRFAWVNVSKDNDNPRFQWRLSESMGIVPDSIVQPPADFKSSLSATNQRLVSINDTVNHYAYNIADIDSPDMIPGDTFSSYKPAKSAYDIVFAKLKSTIGNKYTDNNFKAVILDQEKVLGEGSGYADPISVTPPAIGGGNSFVSANAVVADLQYTSPTLEISPTYKSRLGTEYVGNIATGTFIPGIDDYWVLARTNEDKPSLTASYDNCLHLAHLYDVISSAGSTCPTERILDDTKWATGLQDKPKSKSGKYLLGEFPFRSDGQAILLPVQVYIGPGTKSGGTIEFLDNNYYPTMALIKVKNSSDNNSAQFFDSTGTDAAILFEISLYNDEEDGTMLVGLPSLKFVGFESGGGISSIDEFFGVKVGTIVLDNLGGDKTSSDPSEFQIANIGQLTWPVLASSLSSSIDCTTGFYFLAFEEGGRVDIAVRTSQNSPFAIIRDITLRIPDPDTNTNNSNNTSISKKKDASTLPSASMPSVISDGTTKTLMFFYCYKNKILCKKIPFEILLSGTRDTITGLLTPVSEKSLIGKLHAITPSMVYDPDASNPSTEGQDQSQNMSADIAASAVKITIDPTASKPSSGNSNKTIDQHCAILDKYGYTFDFVSVSGKIVVRRSPNLGDGWTSVFTDGFTFMPKGQGTSSDPNAEELISFVLYDEAVDNFMMFYIFSNALMLQKIPGEMLRDNVENASLNMAKISAPKMLFGTITPDLISRHVSPVPSTITGNTSSTGDQQTDPVIPFQRIAGYITGDGRYRIFFRDEQGLLHSIISFDSGEEWLSELEYEKFRSSLNTNTFFTDPKSFNGSVSEQATQETDNG